MDALVGLFGVHPVPLEYSGTTCSNGCQYCFANAAGGQQSDYVRFQILIRKLDKRSCLAGELFKAGLPVLLSNRSDPFCAANYRETLSVLKLLRQFPNGIYFQTKTGDAITEACDILEGRKNVAFFVTITCANDKLSKQLEPGAPATSERLEWAGSMAEAGVPVILAFNPLVKRWMPEKPLREILDVADALGIRHFYFGQLHCEATRKYPPSLFELAGMTAAETDTADNAYEIEDYVTEMMAAYPKANYHTGMCPQADFVYLDLIDILGGGFRPVATYQCLIEQGIQQGYDSFSWQSFCEFMSAGNEALFEREFPQSWLERYLYIQQRAVYMEHPPLHCFKDLLKLFWNDKRFHCCLQNHRRYKVLDKDEDGNVILGLRNILFDDKGRVIRDRRGLPIELMYQ